MSLAATVAENRIADRRRLAAAALAAAAAAVLAGCRGPALRLANPDGHTVFVDGSLVDGSLVDGSLVDGSLVDGSLVDGGRSGAAAEDPRADDPAAGDLAPGDLAAGDPGTAGPAPADAAPPDRARGVTLPFRYYGTTRWDALPADDGGFADFDLSPASEAVRIEPPASPLLFPLDFGIELVGWLWHGPRDRTARVTLPPTSGDVLTRPLIAPDAVGALSERARAARAER